MAFHYADDSPSRFLIARFAESGRESQGKFPRQSGFIFCEITDTWDGFLW